MRSKIEFIYTFLNRPQETCVHLLHTTTPLESAQQLSDYAICHMTPQSRRDLIKVSVAVYVHEKDNITPPEWYLECNGKLFYENGNLITKQS